MKSIVNKYCVLLFSAFFTLLPAITDAACTERRGIKKPLKYVKKFTNYAPAARPGSMNGRCGTSASGRDACKYLLEDHLNGDTPAVMAAVPQRGGTSSLFGGLYGGEALERALGTSKCITIAAGDRYNTRSNGLSKMDIVTKAEHSNLTKRVNAARGYLVPIGRMKDLPVPSRKIKRNPEALASNQKNPNRDIASIPDKDIPIPTPRPERYDPYSPANVPIPTPRPQREEEVANVPIPTPRPEKEEDKTAETANVPVPVRRPAQTTDTSSTEEAKEENSSGVELEIPAELLNP